MRKSTFMAVLALGLIAVPAFATRDLQAAPEVSASKLGSLLYWTDVEVKYDSNDNLIQDTFIELTNDSLSPVSVQLYFVNGDDPICDELRSGTPPFILLERTHPGCNFVDAQIQLTHDQPTWWSAARGTGSSPLQTGVPPFGNLDKDPTPLGNPDHVGNGRLDPDDPSQSTRTVRGFIVGWAVATSGEAITHNFLTGSATIVNYAIPAAWSYNAFAFARLTTDPGSTFNPDPGRPTDFAGQLHLDGVEYDRSPARLEFDFFSTSSILYSGNPAPGCLLWDTDLTIQPTGLNFLPARTPVVTFVQADIWDQNETRVSGAGRCIVCWDSTLLRNFQGVAGNMFLRDNINTDKGKARLTGRSDPSCSWSPCDDSITVASTDSPLLGVSVKLLGFIQEAGRLPIGAGAAAGSTLTLQGTDDTATIKWDIVEPGTELIEDQPTLAPSAAPVLQPTKNARAFGVRGN